MDPRPFWDGAARTLTYELVLPGGFTGTATFSGQALLFGATATTGGDTTVTIGPPVILPGLSLVKVAPGLFGVSVTGELGHSYRIDATENLNSGTWTQLLTFSLTHSPFVFVDSDSPTKPKRFYRITVMP